MKTTKAKEKKIDLQESLSRVVRPPIFFIFKLNFLSSYSCLYNDISVQTMRKNFLRM